VGKETDVKPKKWGVLAENTLIVRGREKKSRAKIDVFGNARGEIMPYEHSSKVTSGSAVTSWLTRKSTTQGQLAGEKMVAHINLAANKKPMRTPTAGPAYVTRVVAAEGTGRGTGVETDTGRRWHETGVGEAPYENGSNDPWEPGDVPARATYKWFGKGGYNKIRDPLEQATRERGTYIPRG